MGGRYSLFTVLLLVLALVFPSFADTTEEKITLKGRVFIPTFTKRGIVTEKFFSLAPVKVVDLRTGETVAETTTQIDGGYSVLVDPSGLYLVKIGVGDRTIMDIFPKLRREKTQDLSFADSRSTALALVLLRLISGKKNPTATITYRTSRILRSELFSSLEFSVKQSLARGRVLKENPEIQRLVMLVTQNGEEARDLKETILKLVKRPVFLSDLAEKTGKDIVDLWKIILELVQEGKVSYFSWQRKTVIVKRPKP